MDETLKQILSELKELRQGQEALIGRVGNLEQGQETHSQELEELRMGLTKLTIHVEGEITEKTRGLYGARSLILGRGLI